MLYAKLLGETAEIEWQALQPFFARGVVLWVARALDLIAVAEALAEDRHEQVKAWMDDGQLAKLADEQAADWHQRDPQLWAVVINPWVLVQERNTAP